MKSVYHMPVSSCLLTVGYNVSHLNIMFRKFLGQGDTAARSRIDGVVDGNLAVLVVQPGINVLSALLEDLLAEHNRSRRGIWVKIILWDMATLSSGPAVVTQVEDPGLDAKPATNEHEEW